MDAMSEKDCYGILDRVFPKTDQGLRQVPLTCFECPERVACLKDASRQIEEGEKK
jgi:hypothetical protein